MSLSLETEVNQTVTGPIHAGAPLLAQVETRLGLDHATCAQLSQDLNNLIQAKQQKETFESKNKKTQKVDYSQPNCSIPQT